MKFINSFFFGLLFCISLIFVLLVGLKSNYFDFYGVKEYFNAIYFDWIRFEFLLPLSFVVGYVMLYCSVRNFVRVAYVIIMLAALLCWEKDIGLKVGRMIFMGEPYTHKIGKKYIEVRKIYLARDKIYLKREDNDIVIRLDKN